MTHSWNTPVVGLRQFVAANEVKIRRGLTAYQALVKMREGDTSQKTLDQFNEYKRDIGYSLLLKRFYQEYCRCYKPPN